MTERRTLYLGPNRYPTSPAKFWKRFIDISVSSYAANAPRSRGALAGGIGGVIVAVATGGGGTALDWAKTGEAKDTTQRGTRRPVERRMISAILRKSIPEALKFQRRLRGRPGQRNNLFLRSSGGVWLQSR